MYFNASTSQSTKSWRLWQCNSLGPCLKTADRSRWCWRSGGRRVWASKQRRKSLQAPHAQMLEADYQKNLSGCSEDFEPVTVVLNQIIRGDWLVACLGEAHKIYFYNPITLNGIKAELVDRWYNFQWAWQAVLVKHSNLLASVLTNIIISPQPLKHTLNPPPKLRHQCPELH